MKLSIIVPVYNEERTISDVIEQILAVDLGAIDREVIIANDGSSDGTERVIETSSWINDPRVRVCNNPINLGKGAAVRHGTSHATPRVAKKLGGSTASTRYTYCSNAG